MAHQRAEAMVGRVILNAPPKPRPEPREVVQTGRRNEEPGNPERIPARTQQRIVACWKTSPKYDKARYEVALRGQIPRGVSSNHVLSRAFGDAFQQM